MASFVAVVVGFFGAGGGRGRYVLFKKKFFCVCVYGFFSPFLMENL